MKNKSLKEPYKGESWRKGYQQGIKEAQQQARKDGIEEFCHWATDKDNSGYPKGSLYYLDEERIKQFLEENPSA